VPVKANVARPDDYVPEEQEWGRLIWMVSGALGNSQTMTVGKCFIKPGQANPPHYHPNCDEVLHVLRGRIEHRVDDEFVEMTAGDTISIPTGRIHNARNIGSEEAEFLISFSSADRQVVGE
jgi:quercetin dioxygenase-like cupin family protein